MLSNLNLYGEIGIILATKHRLCSNMKEVWNS